MDLCPFCVEIQAGSCLASSEFAVAFADRYPVATGHALVVSRSHVASLYDLDAVEQAAVWDLAAHVRCMLALRHQPDGFTIGINVGVAAGQTVSHAHVHVIPRYQGDIADPRGGIRWVLPQHAAYWTI